MKYAQNLTTKEISIPIVSEWNCSPLLLPYICIPEIIHFQMLNEYSFNQAFRIFMKNLLDADDQFLETTSKNSRILYNAITMFTEEDRDEMLELIKTECFMNYHTLIALYSNRRYREMIQYMLPNDAITFSGEETIT